MLGGGGDIGGATGEEAVKLDSWKCENTGCFLTRNQDISVRLQPSVATKAGISGQNMMFS